MRRAIAPFAVVVAALTSIALTFAAIVTPAAASTHARRASVLHLAAQQLTVAPGGTATFDVSVADVPPDATLVATVYGRLASPRQGVADALDGRIKAGAVGSPLSFPLANLARHDDHVTIAIPSVTLAKDAKAGVNVRMATAGLYPVRIEARSADDEQIAQLLTFVLRLDDPTKPATLPKTPLQVAVVLAADAPPTLRPDGTTVIDANARAQLTAIAQVLAAEPFVSLTVSLPPELLDALSRSSASDDVALLDALTSSLGQRQLLSRPYVHMDPAVVARSHLEAEFTNQLARGEDTLRRLFPDADPDRATWLVDHALDDASLRLIRGLGVKQLVIPTDLVTSSPSTPIATPTSTTSSTANGTTTTTAVSSPGTAARVTASAAIGVMRTSPGDGSTTIDAAVVDDLYTAALANNDDPVLAAQLLLVELMARRLEQPIDGASYGVVLSPRDLTAARATLEPLLDGLLSTSFLVPATVDHFVSTVTIAGTSRFVRASADDLSAHAAALADARTYIKNTASMEVVPEPRNGDELLGVASATNIDASTRGAYLTNARAQVDGLRHAIVAQPRSTITLAGQVKRVTVTVRSNPSVPLQVRLHLASSGNKIAFPVNDQLITIENGLWKNQIEVAPRTNGAIAVSLQLLTPVGNDVVGEQNLDVRVVGLSGLGIVLSGGALLVLLTWWIHHLRRRARARVTTTSLDPS